MGNDIDVCSKDDLDGIFWAHHGPKDESAIQFFRRGYNKFCDSLSAPKRKEYSGDDLELDDKPYDMKDFFSVLEFHVFSQDITLHACLWKRIKFHDKYKRKDDHKLCIFYLHTNTRCLADSLEIISLAHELDASLLSFDLPGCGKSEGCLSGTIDKDIKHLIEWVQCIIDPDVKVIIWARGMSTAPAIQYAYNITLAAEEEEQQQEEEEQQSTRSSFWFGSSSKKDTSVTKEKRKSGTDAGLTGGTSTGNSSGTTSTSKNTTPSKFALSTVDVSTGETIDYNYNKAEASVQDTPVIALILDSPFIGVKQVVTDGIEKFQGGGYMVPSSLIRLCSRMVISTLAKQLGGLDAFKIQPLAQAPKAYIPAYIYSANEDDYIPSYHGDRIAAAYGGYVERSIIKGKHFTDRTEEMVLRCVDFICKVGKFEKVSDIEVVPIVVTNETDSEMISNNNSSKSNTFGENTTDQSPHNNNINIVTQGSLYNFTSENEVLKNYSDSVYHDYFADLTKTVKIKSVVDLDRNEGEGCVSLEDTTEEDLNLNFEEASLLENNKDYEVIDYNSEEYQNAQKLKNTNIAKSVSFDNLQAMAKSRSNTNLHKLGTLGNF